MRIRALSIIILMFFILLLTGLFYLQAARGVYYKEKSFSNRIRLESMEAPRGRMFDRRGEVAVGSRISFDVAVIPQELRDKERVFRCLGEMLDVSVGEIEGAYERNKTAPFAPVTVRLDVGKEKAIRLEEAGYSLPGVVLLTSPLRSYGYGHVGSHIFGYTGLISKTELTKLRNYGYQRKNRIGRCGLEKYLDNYLRGKDGGSQIEVNSRGRKLRVLGLREPVPGKDIYLTIDMELQKKLDDLMSEHRGAAIVMHPETGEILGLVSKPNFDPNIFLSGSNSGEVEELLKGKDFPLFNRAISGQYPLGSVFKVVVASAAVDSGALSSQKKLLCDGSYSLGKSVFKCWREKGHGELDAEDALKHSCNVFFYQAGRIAGVDRISDYGKRYGYGVPTGIDMPGETGGILPSRMWKMMAIKQAWYEGDTVNFAIGQGYLAVTPLQVARMMAAVANGGRLVRPYLVKKIGALDAVKNLPKEIKISGETLDLIRSGLVRVINERGGTGRRAMVDGVMVAGKTGTAQASGGDTHAWFAGFAPADEPKACVVVFLEHGGKGGLNAAMIAKMIFEELRLKGYL